MILESIVFGGTLGYLAGKVVAEGTTITEEHGVKTIKIDLIKGCEVASKNKTFQTVRDLALISGTGYIYSRFHRASALKSAERTKLIKQKFTDINKGIDSNLEGLVNDKYEKLDAIIEYIEGSDNLKTLSSESLFDDRPGRLRDCELRDMKVCLDLANGLVDGSASFDTIWDRAEIETLKDINCTLKVVGKDLMNGLTWSADRTLSDLNSLNGELTVAKFNR